MNKYSMKPSLANYPKVISSVKETIRSARGSLTQAEFVEFLRRNYGINTSQGLISKYESGINNPPSNIIDKCLEIIHGKNSDDDISLTALEVRMKKVLRGPSQADARKAFAIILDSLAQISS